MREQTMNVPSGLYAIHNPEASLGQLASARSRSLDIVGPPKAKAEMHHAVAVLPVWGVMLKDGWLTPGVDDLKAEFQKLADSDNVDAIVLDIHSPGGETAGVFDFARTVYQARSRKRIVAYCNDLACSAAYWVASQAHLVMANETAVVGSVGVFKVVVDSSGNFEKQGVKVHCVSTGHYKGAGLAGTPVGDEHLEQDQRMVDTVFDTMLRGIAQGRGMDLGQARQLMGDGRVHVVTPGGDAVKLRFIDKVGFFEDALAEAGAAAMPKDKRTRFSAEEIARMSTEEKFAAMLELAATKTKLEADTFTLKVREAQADQPGLSWSEACTLVRRREPELHAAYVKLTGGPSAEAFKDPVASVADRTKAAEFLALVDARVRQGARAKEAVLKAAKQRPDLHQAWLNHTNVGRGGADNGE